MIMTDDTATPTSFPELSRTTDALYTELAEALRSPHEVINDMDAPVQMILSLRAADQLGVVTKAKAAAVFCSQWQDREAYPNLPERLAWDLINAVLEVAGEPAPWTDRDPEAPGEPEQP